MAIKAVVMPNTYADSMVLMALSTKVNQLPEVTKAMIGMGTNLNKQVIFETGLGSPEIEAATPRDQIIVVECETEAECDAVIEKIDELRSAGPVADGETTYASTYAAFEATEDSPLVVISVPGEHAAAEARKALDADKHVMIFSDNVSVADEVELKRLAHERELLVMGPDCGTAIINGLGLCFANAVNPGSIGVVGASGTGSQEVSVQIDALGAGVSQLIGVGGRDLSEEVGGIMMLDGLAMLDEDPQTEVIILLSKPPAPAVASRVLEAAGKAQTPVIVCFIGAQEPDELPANVEFVSDTLAAARAAVARVQGTAVSEPERVALEPVQFRDGQDQIRGLFCGGTVCDEVFHALKARLSGVGSNVAKDPALKLGAGEFKHTLIDLGDDEYTQGRPHPMIDPTLRNAQIEKVGADERVAVLVLDFEIGYGSHPDPVGASASAVAAAIEAARADGRELAVIAYVLGTDKDPQGLAHQQEQLRELGVHVVGSAVELAQATLELISE